MGEPLTILNLPALEVAALQQDPYPHVIIPDLLRSHAHESIVQDFPSIDFRGSLPLSELRYGKSCAQLIAEIEGPAFREAIENKFAIDLSERPVFTTVRGR